MRDSQNRDIWFLDFVIVSDPVNAPKRDMRYLLGRIYDMYVNNPSQTEKWRRSNDRKLYIRDMELNESEAIFLLCYADGLVPNIPITNLDTNEQREEKLLNREAKPLTSHLIIKLDSNSENPFRFQGILEESSYINREKVQTYFNFLLRKIAKENSDFEMDSTNGERDSNGQVKKCKFKNLFEVQGHLSKDFYTAIENGKLTNISLVSDEIHLNYADDLTVKPVTKSISIKPVNDKWGDRIREHIDSSRRIANDNNYGLVKISFKSSDKTSHTVSLDSSSGNVFGNGFIRRERINGFSQLLSEAEQSINTSIKVKMLRLFERGV